MPLRIGGSFSYWLCFVFRGQIKYSCNSVKNQAETGFQTVLLPVKNNNNNMRQPKPNIPK